MHPHDKNMFLKFLGFWAFLKILSDKPKEISYKNNNAELSPEAYLLILLFFSILVFFNSSGWLNYISLFLSIIFFIGCIKLVLKLLLGISILILIIFLLSVLI